MTFPAVAEMIAEQVAEVADERAHAPVLYVIEQGDYSGAEVMHLPLMRGDAQALLACPPGSRTEAWAQAAGIATAPLRQRTMRHSAGPLEALRSIPRGLAAARDLRRLLQDRPERTIVYAVAIRSGLLASVAALGLKRHVVWFVSDFTPPVAPLRWLVRRIARLGCHTALATSQAVADDFAGRSRTLARRTRVVYPGVETQRFANDGRARDRARAAVLGHVSPTKRTDIAVAVTRAVAPQHPEFHLDVLGRAQYRDEDFAFERDLQAEVAADATLREHLTFTGYVDDPATALGRYGILLHCRPDEPFGIAVVEAMAAGMAVVVPDSAGPKEIVEHERTGLVYPPGDAGAAAAQVRRLLADPALRDRLAAAGQASAAARFSTARQLAEMRASFLQIARS